MDKWKLDGDGIGNDDKDGFSFGEPGKSGGDFDSASYDSSYKNNKIKGRERYDNKRDIFKKIFYVVLSIAAIISAYYFFETFFSGNNLNIKLFALKTIVYRSNKLPENNLAVTGYLLNKNSFPVSYVRLTGRLYSNKNITLVTKHVYAGNFIGLNRLKNMPNVEIDMKLNNRLGNNMSNIEILPNHPIKFMVVFFNIAPNTKNYSITVNHFYIIKKSKK